MSWSLADMLSPLTIRFVNFLGRVADACLAFYLICRAWLETLPGVADFDWYRGPSCPRLAHLTLFHLSSISLPCNFLHLGPFTLRSQTRTFHRTSHMSLQSYKNKASTPVSAGPVLGVRLRFRWKDQGHGSCESKFTVRLVRGHAQVATTSAVHKMEKHT